MGGLERRIDHADQIAPDRVQIDGPAQPPGERGHEVLGVVALPVEPAVDGTLHPPAQRVEQGPLTSVATATATEPLTGSTRVASRITPANTPPSRAVISA